MDGGATQRNQGLRGATVPVIADEVGRLVLRCPIHALGRIEHEADGIRSKIAVIEQNVARRCPSGAGRRPRHRADLDTRSDRPVTSVECSPDRCRAHRPDVGVGSPLGLRARKAVTSDKID
jgi:hypothetical protein